LTENLDQFPETDVLLLLSVYHQWFMHLGPEKAGELLAGVWARTRDCMFFSCAEASSSHRSDYIKALKPLGETGEAVRETLEFLLNGLEVAQVSYLGSASFLDYSQKIGKDNRMFFKVSRMTP